MTNRVFVRSAKEATLLVLLIGLLVGGSSAVVAQTIVDLAQAGQSVTIFGEEADDHLGISQTAVGDFNGDGVMDLLVGAHHADGPGNSRSGAGEAYVYFGSAELPAELDVAGRRGRRPDIIVYGEDGRQTGTYSTALESRDPEDAMGEVVTAGDLDGDGFDDLVISAALADGPRNQRPDCGEVYIVFGRSQAEWERLCPSLYQPAAFDVAGTSGLAPDLIVYGADEADMLLGTSVGDIDGDGIDDLLLDAGHGDGWYNNLLDAGDAYILLGKRRMHWGSTVDLRASSADVTFYGHAADDHLRWAGSAAGSASRTCDIDADGVDDVILVASHAGNTAGELYVFFGRPSWPQEIRIARPSTFPAPPPDRHPDLTLHGIREGDQMGCNLRVGSVAVGDVDADGIDDLLIGAPSAAGTRGSGSLYIVKGRPRSAWPVPSAAMGPISVTMLAATWIHGADMEDRFGASIAVGDLNGDGIADIAIGAPGGDGPGNGRTGCGEVVILRGRAQWSSRIDCAVSPPDAIVYGEDPNDELGAYLVSVGDVSGDRASDLVAGGLAADGPGDSRRDAGQTYVICGIIF